MSMNYVASGHDVL